MNGTNVDSSTSVAKLAEPILDVGNLLMLDSDETLMRDQRGKQSSESQLLARTRDNTQYLFNQIWALPQHTVDRAICAKLPEPTYLLPREKPVPKPREPTKWEKFAKEKGILSKKAKRRQDGNKVWDDATKDWMPRYGYRPNENGPGGPEPLKKDWLIEIPDQKDPYKDYFEERNEAKRERMAKQELQRLRNIRRQSGLSGADHMLTALPPSMHKGKKGAPKCPLTGPNRMQVRKAEAKESSRVMTHKVHQAKKATASMGQHEPAMKGERKPKGGGQKRKLPSAANNDASGMDAERKQQLSILERVQAKRPKMTESRFNAAAMAGDEGGGGDGDGGGRKARREKPRGKHAKERATKSKAKGRK